jgi:hypothetical protein
MNSIGTNNISRKSLIILAAFALLGTAIYALSAAWFYRPGFPLDDAWIHLTYARNLATLQQWSFISGQNSAGSTSPLWTFLLSLGFFLNLSPYFWAYCLGGLMLFLLAWRVDFTLRQLQPAYTTRIPWAGLVIIFEWHLAWASVSGMEVVLHALVVTTVLSMLLLNSSQFLLMGILTGLSVWARPDGLTLLAPLGLFVLLQPVSFRKKTNMLMRLGLGFLAFFIPYLLFNFLLSGTPWPNTFYAKQAEYAEWQTEPFYEKLWVLLQQFFSGSTLVFLPGVILLLLKSLKQRHWAILLSFAWLAGYAWLYVSRLRLYQYGRYIMPIIPIFLLLGQTYILGWLPQVRTRWQRRLRFAWLTFILLFGLLFWAVGIRTFSENVAWIESEMVQTARWAADNLPPDALIAAHDIGALGYFDGQHQIVDLAGLISPEIIPFMLQEDKLLAYLTQRHVTHIIAFPYWYPELTQNCEMIYQTDGRYANLDDLGDMAVYLCPKP